MAKKQIKKVLPPKQIKKEKIPEPPIPEEEQEEEEPETVKSSGGCTSIKTKF